MRVVVLSSGGKDSAAAWWWATCRGWDVKGLVTVSITGDDSPMFQIPSTHLVEQQAELAELPWINVQTSGDTPDDIEALETALSSLDIDGFVSGALRSDYQKSRLERMAERLGVKSWTPLWHQSGQDHVQQMIEHGFEIMITGVSAEGLDKEWLGHVLTSSSFERLKELARRYRFHVEGEGGEYETLVVAGPHMSGRLEVAGEVMWDGVRGHMSFH
ncbi:MAG: diphthine--ammonia ligase [Candidatus Poseidonia sp.]|nr:diphthine--ammonia ligase [Poseidonia sp.]